MTVAMNTARNDILLCGLKWGLLLQHSRTRRSKIHHNGWCSLVKSVRPATAAAATMDPIQAERMAFGCRSWESQLRFDCRRGQPDCIGPAPELRGGENAKSEYCCSKVQPDESSVCVRRERLPEPHGRSDRTI